MEDDDSQEPMTSQDIDVTDQGVDVTHFADVPGEFTGDVSDIIGWNYAAAVPSDTRKKTRKEALKQIREEVKELSTAIDQDDEVEQLDALIDIIWVCTGYAFRAGMDIEGALAEVFYSNQTKILLNSRLDTADVDIAQIDVDGEKGCRVVEADYSDIDQEFFLFRTGSIQDKDNKVKKPLGYEPPDLTAFVSLGKESNDDQ